MNISSMTGFARSEGSSENCTWVWEVKSVNGKGLDVRLRLPRGFDFLERKTRDAFAGRFKRGNMQVNLELSWGDQGGGIAVNEQALHVVLNALSGLQHHDANLAQASPDGILALRGVLETSDNEISDEARQALEGELLDGLGRALDQLEKTRIDEGQRMGAVLQGQLDAIERFSGEAGALAAMQPEAIRARLKQQVEALMADVKGIDETRLAQEAALLMIKADVREELDRLQAHSAAARDLLIDDGAIGRRLDFLCQEFNREANTLCAKSTDVELTRVGLELKAVIEQFREQVQNIE